MKKTERKERKQKKEVNQKSANQKPARRVGVKWHIIIITTLPLLFACGVITFFASWILDSTIQEQVYGDLKSSVTGVLMSLDNISKEDFRLSGDELYKGRFNVTQNMDSIDSYAQTNEIQISIYYGDVCRATTLKDSSSNRLLGTKASSVVTAAVLNKGQAYTDKDEQIENYHYYCYYMPITDGNGNVIGMIFGGREKAQILHYIRSRIIFIIIIAMLNYMSCFGLAVSIANKKFLHPIRVLNVAADELARGNINHKIKKESNDEFGDLTDAFEALMDNINSQALVAEKMAEGDLTVTHEPLSDEDVMGHAISRMVKDNNTSLKTINVASDKMISGVRDIALASNSLAQGTTEQASAVEEITASIHGIADSAVVNVEGANKANELVKKTRDEAVLGNEQMHHMMEAMQEINEASENISKIMKIIDDIAFQTNIISLNASVEAARAGEHGKGFAVVAEEIRSLADKCAEAAKSSAEMIEDSIKKTTAGSKLAAETAESLEEIAASVEEMTTLINEIAELSENQSASVSQVNTGLAQISDVLQTNSATSQQCAATSTELSNLAEQLKMAVARYKLNYSGHEAGL